MHEKNRSDSRIKPDATKIRVFVAITLPRQVISALAELQSALKRFGLKMKWTRPENIHLTLKFLGDVSKNDIDTVNRVIEKSAAGFEPINLRAQGVGFFPGVTRPRVLWTGLSGQTDVLGKLQEKIENDLSEIGYLREKRKFTGHLTLGRLKGHHHPDVFIKIMQQFKDRASDPFVADTIYVMQSDLTPSGPIYSKLAGIELKK